MLWVNDIYVIKSMFDIFHDEDLDFYVSLCSDEKKATTFLNWLNAEVEATEYSFTPYQWVALAEKDVLSDKRTWFIIRKTLEYIGKDTSILNDNTAFLEDLKGTRHEGEWLKLHEFLNQVTGPTEDGSKYYEPYEV